MTAYGLTIFASPIGSCGLAWGPDGVVGVQLPEATDAATRARLSRRFPAACALNPPGDIERAITGVVDLLSGRKIDLGFIRLDMAGVPPFHRHVYDAARSIAPGHTLTYGEVAARIGDPGAARAVGQALGRNPFAIIVPCHRVLAAGGRPGGFSARGGVATKFRLLAIEGAEAARQPSLFDGLAG
jgi:methylated-DNA-[protein]-cysteine S-methyltransferase